MASVHRHARSPFWYMAYRTPGGKRKFVSSGTTDKYEAERIALALEGIGQRYSRQRAMRLVDEIAEAHGDHLLDLTPLEDFLRAFREANAPRWAQSTLAATKSHHGAFTALLGPIATGHVTQAHVMRFRDHLLRNGKQPSTVRAAIQTLRAAFADLPDNPADGVSIPSVPDQSPRRPFSREQFEALLAATKGDWHLFILVCGLTGQRQGDVLRLQMEDIEPDRILFRRSKNKDTHPVPMHPRIKEALPKRKTGPLLPDLSRRRLQGRNSIPQEFRKVILPSIGIIQHPLPNTRNVFPYTLHSLRHMLSTELDAAGVSPEIRRKIIGHTSMRISSRYTHAAFDTATSALGKVLC